MAHQNEKLFAITMYNDEVSTMEFVVFILQSIFDKSVPDAQKLMIKVHNDGSAVVGQYPLAMAKTKAIAVEQLARSRKFPLRCSVEGEGEGEGVQQNVPKGWILSGSEPNDYEVGLDSSIRYTGERSAYLMHSVSEPNGFGTLMQQFSPGEYLGKRLRMRMWVRAEEVGGRAQPWLRVDGPTRNQMNAFDNTCNRPTRGTQDWREYILVLDVPDDSTNIAFGILLAGRGKTWIDNIRFEVVDQDVDTTDCPCSKPKREKNDVPTNLTFDEN